MSELICYFLFSEPGFWEMAQERLQAGLENRSLDTCFWSKNHASEMDFSKSMIFFFYSNERPAFHTHFIDFGGVGTNEKC